MKILGFEIRKAEKKKLPVSDYTSGDIFSYTPYMSTGELLSNTTVNACVSIIADSVAMLSCNVYRRRTTASGRQSREIAFDSVLYPLLRKCPNTEDKVPFVFFQQVMYHLLLRGNAFIYHGRATGYDPHVVNLYALDPEKVEICRDKETKEIFYKYYCDGKTYKYGTDTVLHIPAYKWNNVRGESPLEHATHAAGLGLRLDEYTDNFFTKGITSKLMLTVPKDNKSWNEEDSKVLSNRVVNSYGGPENAHKPIILTHGLQAQSINIAGNSDSQLVENRQFSEKEIAKIFRVPLYMLGKDDAKFTNTEQMNTFFLQSTLTPWIVRLQQSLSTLLPPEENDCYVEFDTGSMLRADIKSRHEIYQKAITDGLYSINDILEMENMPLLEESIGDVHFMPVNLMPLTKENVDAYMANQKMTISTKNSKEENNEE